MVDFVVGGPATDADFLFRKEFVKDLWELAQKNNILLLAPRRMGKTSVMYELVDNHPKEWMAVYLNVEELDNPKDFCLHLINALYEYHPNFVREYLSKALDLIKDFFNRAEIEISDFKLSLKKSCKDKKWPEQADQLIDHLEQWGEKNNKKVLFLIDELPDMLDRMTKSANDDLGTFVHWFRKIRTKRRSQIRWILAGSVNIEGTLSKIDELKSINDLHKEYLPPFTADEVKIFVTSMLNERDVKFDPEIIPSIQNLIGTPIPFFLQLFTQELYRFYRKNGMVRLNQESVERVFQEALIGERARDKLQHFRSRINLHYPEMVKEMAFQILDKLSLSEAGMSRNGLFGLYQEIDKTRSKARSTHYQKEDFNTLMILFESDFYIKETPAGDYDFTSYLLKQWWKKYYGYSS